MREIHFFESEMSANAWYSYHWGPDTKMARDYENMDAIQRNTPEGDVTIATTQMCFLSTLWIEYGFRIYVHDRTGDFEIVLGEGNERTSRHIRRGHNLYRLWCNGEFATPRKKEEEK